jgi:hypothetical protein
MLVVNDICWLSSFTYVDPCAMYSLAQLLALDLASNCEVVIEQVLSPKFANDHLRDRASSIDLDQEEFWLGTENVSHKKNPSNLIRLRPPIAVYVSFYTSHSLVMLQVMLKLFATLLDLRTTSRWQSW